MAKAKQTTSRAKKAKTSTVKRPNTKTTVTVTVDTPTVTEDAETTAVAKTTTVQWPKDGAFDHRPTYPLVDNAFQHHGIRPVFKSANPAGPKEFFAAGFGLYTVFPPNGVMDALFLRDMPDDGILLQDAHIPIVEKSPIIKKPDRCKYFPGDYNAKGYLLATRPNRGRPAFRTVNKIKYFDHVVRNNTTIPLWGDSGALLYGPKADIMDILSKPAPKLALPTNNQMSGKPRNKPIRPSTISTDDSESNRPTSPLQRSTRQPSTVRLDRPTGLSPAASHAPSNGLNHPTSSSLKRQRSTEILGSVKRQGVHSPILKETESFLTASARFLEFVYARVITDEGKQECEKFATAYDRLVDTLEKEKRDLF
ncbi:MAG: hypothetical protein HETSPECPRED_009264 [Heterodermia speciosa]|uniref:Uncharacterized protein n=1 Tax=Heterodermia speciosa TaxID=116794 RepID=A0A8H3G495_9LECA|nr:MAG: hypothetical protein HETSPECPRED_009264 [Heterodermia speciosa]